MRLFGPNIGKLKRRRDVLGLIRLLEGRGRDRLNERQAVKTVEALGELQDPRAFGILKQMVLEGLGGETSPKLQLAALRALRRYDDLPVLRFYLEVVSQGLPVEKAVLHEALAGLAGLLLYSKVELTVKEREQAVASLIKIMESGKAGSVSTRRATLCLGLLGDERALGALAEVLEQANNPSFERALEALVNIGTPAAEQVLHQTLESDEEEVRLAATLAMAKLGHEPSIRGLIRIQALAAGEEEGDDQHAWALLQEVTQTLVEEVDPIKTTEGYLEALEDDDWRVRAFAAEMLSLGGAIGAMEDLQELLDKDPREEVREAAEEALAGLEDG